VSASTRRERHKQAASQLLVRHGPSHARQRPFAYYFAQREAVETLIYSSKSRASGDTADLIERYATVPGIHVLQNDDFARYAIKMATGSGKTKVMALTIAWQYFNAVAEGRDDTRVPSCCWRPTSSSSSACAPTSLVGASSRTDPVIPPELRIFWDLDCYMRGETEHSSSEGALYVTNIQQLYDVLRLTPTSPR